MMQPLWSRLVELRGRLHILSQHPQKMCFLGWLHLSVSKGAWPTHRVIEYWQDQTKQVWSCLRITTCYGGCSVHRRADWRYAVPPPDRLARQQELIGQLGFCTSFPIEIPVYGDQHVGIRG